MKVYPVIKPQSTLPKGEIERICRIVAITLAVLTTYSLFIKILFF